MKDTVRYSLQLFVADQAANSVLALANLRAICKAHLRDAHEIEVVDVFAQPERALSQKIFMTPTLVIVEPAPLRRLVGNLSETDVVLHALGLESQP
jgi:circadian clock protein KaiB